MKGTQAPRWNREHVVNRKKQKIPLKKQCKRAVCSVRHTNLSRATELATILAYDLLVTVLAIQSPFKSKDLACCYDNACNEFTEE